MSVSHTLGLVWSCLMVSTVATAADDTISTSDPATPDYWQAAWLGLSSSFSMPFEELYAKPYDSEWLNALHGLNISLSYSHPLMQSTPSSNSQLGSATQGASATNNTVQLGLKYTPLSYWFLSLNKTIYLQSDLQNAWNPNWSYSFGYNDWHPWALSLAMIWVVQSQPLAMAL
jgi:hypothetical protein